MKIVKNLIGERFGFLTVVSLAQHHRQKCGKSVVMYNCICDCGNKIVVRMSSLTSRKKQTCKSCSYKKLRLANTKHGQSNTRLYGVWEGIKQRCYNSKSCHYYNYGARGITVCDEWKNDFGKFSEWSFANGYNPNAKYSECTLDRIDGSLGYSPSNCRWVSASVQANNKRTCVYYNFNGETHSLKEWSRIKFINYSTLRRRIKLGWTIEKSLTTPTMLQYKRR